MDVQEALITSRAKHIMTELYNGPTGAGLFWFSAGGAIPEIVRVSREGSGLIRWYYYRIGDDTAYAVPLTGRWWGPVVGPALKDTQS